MTGNNIKKIRQKQELTQKELGNLCGIDEANIRKYENGKLDPSLNTIRKIAAALGVYISDLIDDWDAYSKEEIEADWRTPSAMAREDAIKSGGYPLNNSEKPLLDNYRKLNPTGQNKAIEQVEMLTKIPEYQKEE